MWVQAKEDWIQEGVLLVQYMESMVFGDMFNALALGELRCVWQELTKTVYEVQYLIVLVEHRLDLLS